MVCLFWYRGRGVKTNFYFVSYFSSIFNGGMKKFWATRAYVDLFAGPGLCKERGSGTEFPGSPLIALNCKNPHSLTFTSTTLTLTTQTRLPLAKGGYTPRQMWSTLILTAIKR